MSICWPSSRVTIAFLKSLRVYALAAGELALALHGNRVDRLDLDLEQVGDRLGDLRLGGVQRDAEHDLIGLGQLASPFR